jgi:putative GTP pyrophosphokinase
MATESERNRSAEVAVFESARPVWEEYTGRLKTLIAAIIEHRGIPVAQIEARTKTVDGFEEKLQRKGEKYSNPMVDITDLSAVRVITYYLDDVERVSRALEQAFVIDHTRSVNKAAALDPDQFGYVSVQYILRLSDERAGLPEWKKFGDKWAEVQIRTVSQHAWSSIDHRLNYKSSAAVPRELRRALSRLSALFELADEEFSSLRDRMLAIQEAYVDRVQVGDLELLVDSASVGAYLQTTGVGELWLRRAKDLGYAEASEVDVAGETADLLALLSAAGVGDIRGLDALIKSAESWGESALRVIAEVSLDQDGLPINTTPRLIVADLVAIGSVIPADVLDSLRYADWYVSAVMRARAERLDG